MMPSYLFELGPAADFCEDRICNETKVVYMDRCTVVVSKSRESETVKLILFQEDAYDYWRHIITIVGWKGVGLADIEVRQSSEFGSKEKGEFSLMISKRSKKVEWIDARFSQNWTEVKGRLVDQKTSGEWIARYHDNQFIVLLDRRNLYVLENGLTVHDSNPVIQLSLDVSRMEVCRSGTVILLSSDRSNLYYLNLKLEMQKVESGISDISLQDAGHGNFIVEGQSSNGSREEFYIRESGPRGLELVAFERRYKSKKPASFLETMKMIIVEYEDRMEVIFKEAKRGLSVPSRTRMNIESLVALIHNYKSTLQEVVGVIVPRKEIFTEPVVHTRQFNLQTAWVVCQPTPETSALEALVQGRVLLKMMDKPIGVNVNFMPRGEESLAQKVGVWGRVLGYLVMMMLVCGLLGFCVLYRCYYLKNEKDIGKMEDIMFNAQIATKKKNAEDNEGTLGSEKRSVPPKELISVEGNLKVIRSQRSQGDAEGKGEREPSYEVSYAEEFDPEESLEARKDIEDEKEQYEDYTHPSVRRKI